jgi:hypothetical protein
MVSEPGSQGESREKREPPNRRPIIIRIFRGLKRHEHRRRRRAQQEKSNRDLIMARWTRRVGIFTAALVAVGVVTGVIFWRQLNVMQGQLDELRAGSAQTARASRPYLLFEPIAMTFAPTPEQFGSPAVPPARSFVAIFKFTNYGATPAMISSEGRAVDFPTLDPLSFRNFKETEYAEGFVVGSPKSTKEIKEWQGFGLDTWEKLKGGWANLHFAAAVVYEDVFGNRFETDACFHVDVPFGTLTTREAGANCTAKRT